MLLKTSLVMHSHTQPVSLTNTQTALVLFKVSFTPGRFPSLGDLIHPETCVENPDPRWGARTPEPHLNITNLLALKP